MLLLKLYNLLIILGFDGNIDFTQAAMVVQGSSHIIAKVSMKVFLMSGIPFHV